MRWPEAERPQAIREALQQIEAEIPRLRRYARYLGYEPDHADDLVREGLVRAVAEIPTATAKIHTGPPGTSLRGWLFAILRSCHIDETRRGQHPDAPASTREASSPTTRRNQEAGAALPTLCEAYLSLSEERREVLLLVAIEGLQHEEAGAILGVPLGAVRSRLSQGRQALRQALEAGRNGAREPAAPARQLNRRQNARLNGGSTEAQHALGHRHGEAWGHQGLMPCMRCAGGRSGDAGSGQGQQAHG